MAFFFSASAGTRPDLILTAPEARRQDALRREQARIAGSMAARLLGARSTALPRTNFPDLPTRRRYGR